MSRAAIIAAMVLVQGCATTTTTTGPLRAGQVCTLSDSGRTVRAVVVDPAADGLVEVSAGYPLQNAWLVDRRHLTCRGAA